MSQSLSERDLKKLLVALALYLTSLLAANTLGLKLVPFLFGSHVSVSILFFPFVFLTTDVVGEVYGKRVSTLFVLGGFISTAVFLAYSLISLGVPWAPAGEWAHGSYDQIFGVSARIAFASLVAFAIAEYQDVWSFFVLRKRFGDRWFWLRSLLSNVWSQLLDTVIFMTIAFFGVYETHTLLVLILTWWLFKVAVGFLYTPLSYLGIRLLRA